jgi:hypothetical protein
MGDILHEGGEEDGKCHEKEASVSWWKPGYWMHPFKDRISNLGDLCLKCSNAYERTGPRNKITASRHFFWCI